MVANKNLDILILGLVERGQEILRRFDGIADWFLEQDVDSRCNELLRDWNVRVIRRADDGGVRVLFLGQRLEQRLQGGEARDGKGLGDWKSGWRGIDEGC
jgi:hypothetical protein